MAQDDTGDIFIENGDLPMISGLAAFPQMLSNLLGLAKGESLFYRSAGSRLGELVRDFTGSPWLASLFKLEIIRLSSIPNEDPLTREIPTPLRCVERVRKVEIPSFELHQQRLLIRVELELCGEGKWQDEVKVFIHSPKQLDTVGVMPEWLAGTRGGQDG